jgi:hypothetical protein
MQVDLSSISVKTPDECCRYLTILASVSPYKFKLISCVILFGYCLFLIYADDAGLQVDANFSLLCSNLTCVTSSDRVAQKYLMKPHLIWLVGRRLRNFVAA